MPSSVSTAFLEAASYARSVLAASEVGDAWNDPSSLSRMSVGEVAGHLFLVVRRVDKHIDDPPAPVEADAPAGGFPYPRVDRPEDLDLDVHTQVRLDGQHVARWGWSDVVSAFDAKLDALRSRLPTAPEAIMFSGRAMVFERYLATRVVEVLVHADDLATSVSLEPVGMPVGASEIALEVVTRSARSLHGDRAVLLAFTRRERVPPGAPMIF